MRLALPGAIVSLNLRPEQHDVSWRPPAGRNEGPHHRERHVDFEHVITAALPGTLAQHC